MVLLLALFCSCSSVRKLKSNLKTTVETKSSETVKEQTDATLTIKEKKVETEAGTLIIEYDSSKTDNAFEIEITPSKPGDYFPEKKVKIKANRQPNKITLTQQKQSEASKENSTQITNNREQAKQQQAKTTVVAKQEQKEKLMFHWWWLLIILIVAAVIVLIRYRVPIVSFTSKILNNMKNLFFISMCALLLTSCIKSFTSDNTAKFIELKHQFKWQPKYNADGSYAMIADSIYKNINGVPVKVGINPRIQKEMVQDSVVDVGPGSAVVKKYIAANPLKEIRIIFGIICLLSIGVTWYFFRWTPKGTFFMLPQAVISFVLFYFGMKALQSQAYQASKENTKQISTDQYRHYFTQDPEGVYFWDSIKNKDGFIGVK